jgi:TRAP-type C4-dicarboxylate transport system permease small subunit
VRHFIRGIEIAAGLSLAFMTLATMAAVIMRAGFSRGLPDGYDIASQLLGIAIMWGFATATYQGRHICVDVLWEKSGPSGRWWIDVFADLVSFLFLAAMSVMLMGRVGEVFRSHLATSELRIPLWPFFAIGAVGVTASAIMAAIRAIDAIRYRVP